MKLRFSAASPYVRKVVVTAIETGLDDRIERVETNVWDPNTDVGKDNPLGKVPALVTDGGEVLFDSPVICEFLDSLHDGLKLFPPAGGARWTALRRQALGDGMMDAAILRRLEGLRPTHEQSPGWIRRQEFVLRRALDVLEDEVEALAGAATIGHVALACALGYLDFRFAEDNWRRDHPALADWFEDFAARPSMMQSMPVG